MSEIQLKHKLSKLLDDSHESFYWLGFILADGHLSNSNRLHLTLSLKDKDHLIKLRNFVGEGNILEGSNTLNSKKYPNISLNIMDKRTISVLKCKYKISSNKTISPPDLSSLSKDQLFCVMIGFIDGDGCIRYQTGRKDCHLSVKCHSSWQDTLSYLFEKQCRINNAGYAYLCITDNTLLREIKRKAIEFKLPYLERKWNIIDTTKTSRYITAEQRLNSTLSMMDEKQISLNMACKLLGFKYHTVYNLYRRRKLNNQLTRKEV